MTEPRPLNLTPPLEVPLPRAPLARVVAQTRFPPILAIRDPDRVAAFQEELRGTYPNLSQDQVHSIELTGGQTPKIDQGLIWRLADREKDPGWQVSLGVDFVAVETSFYDSRADFLARLSTVLATVERAFDPASASRLGLRYIDRLTDDAFDHVDEMIHREVLGIIQPSENLDPSLRESVIHHLAEVQFLGWGGARIQGRWGQLPRNTTFDPNALEPVDKPCWVLDLDMFTTESQPFATQGLLTTARSFAECLYSVFRQMVTEEFLTFYGGKP